MFYELVNAQQTIDNIDDGNLIQTIQNNDKYNNRVYRENELMARDLKKKANVWGRSQDKEHFMR